MTKSDAPIKAGQTAGFDGFLIPRNHYEFYTSCMDKLPKCSDALSQIAQSESSLGHDVEMFSVGATVATILILVLRH